MLLQNTCMKTSTKILLILFIIVTIPTFFLGKYLFQGIIPTGNGFTFEIDVLGYVALALIIASTVLGNILYFRFIFSLKLSHAIFFSVLPFTITYAFGVYLLSSLASYTTPLASSVKVALNISAENSYNSILWTVLWTGIYLLYIFIIFAISCKPLAKVEKIALRLGDGRVKDGNFNIGGIKQFKTIENSLEKINFNYKEKERLVKQTDLEAQKYIPKQFLKFLGKNSIMELELGNKVQKRATILICKFVSRDNVLSLKENFNFVNEYTTSLSPIVRKYGGFIDKFMGDGIIAVFGRPENTLDVSNRICEEIEKFNNRKKQSFEIKVKISITTSDVIFGIVGEENRKSPTIVSNVEEFSGKMQKINDYLGTCVLFSKHTLNDLQTDYVFPYRYVGFLTCDKDTKIGLYESLLYYDKHQREKLIKTKNKFEYAVRCYNEGEFLLAKNIFAEILKICPDDKVCYIYYNKASEKTKTDTNS